MSKKATPIIPNPESGVSLVEVAIAVLVLSIGSLGLVSLQISAKRAGFEAMQRTQASALAMGIFERMRANSSVLDDYLTTGVGYAVRKPLPPAPVPNCIGVSGSECTVNELAAWDMWEWERALNGGTTKDTANKSVGSLLNPTACISLEAAGVRIVRVEIAWEGFESLNNSVVSDCGTGSYDSPAGVTNGNRQLLQMTSYLSE
jgi:type IV pilus assembly protein PilV